MFVHTASITLSDDAHRLSRCIVLLLDIVPTLLTRFIPSTYVSLFLPLQFCCSDTQRCSCVILEMRDAMQCTLSFISFPTAHKTPFMHHLYHANAHSEMHKHAQCTETVFRGLEHSQLQAGANSRKMIGACECVYGSY